MRKEQLNNVEEFTEKVSNNLTIQEIEKLSKILSRTKDNSFGLVNIPSTTSRIRVTVEAGENGFIKSGIQKYGTLWSFSGNVNQYIRALKRILVRRRALLN